ncbi:MAG: hypothetical protein AAF787_23595 [Chloroflexota bacterium]
MRKRLLIWQMWRLLRPQYANSAIYNHAQGRSYTVPHIMEAGFLWTLYITRAISRERDKGTFALLAVTPDGALGAGLRMSSAIMHKLIDVTQYMGLAVWIVRFLVVGVWLGRTATFTTNLAEFCLLWGGAVIPIVALWVFHFYDIALAALLGMLFPALTRERTVTPAFAMVFHLFLTVLPVVLFAAGYSLSLVLTNRALPFLLLNGVNALVMIIVCEGTARVLWRRLVDTLDVAYPDAERIRLEGLG